MNRKMAMALILLTLTLPLQGCWNYKELDTWSIVTGIAVDRGYDGHRYHLTFDIADTSAAGKDKPVQTELLESEGDTLFDAVRNATTKSGMRLYFQNCQILVISRELAEEGIVPIIDFAMRHQRIRPTLELFVSMENSAKEILEQKPTTMSITSFEIDEIYEQNESLFPVANYQMLYQNYNTLASTGRGLTLAALKLKDNMGKKTAVLSGMAVFRRDRLIGFLADEDSKYAMYAMDRIKGGVLDVKATTGNTVASLEVYGNKTTVTPIVENGAIRFTLHTETDVALKELDQRTDVSMPEKRNGFKATAEMQLQDAIKEAIKKVQEQLGTDIFDFSGKLHRSDPATWYSVQKDWDEVFRNLQIDVTCNINIRNTTSQMNPVKVGD